MPIYSLGEKKPQLPDNDLYWVAPDAHVIGNVVRKRCWNLVWISFKR